MGSPGSVDFDGLGGYLTVDSDANLALGADAFTIECWIHPNDTTRAGIFDGRSSGAGAYPAISYAVSGSNLVYTVNGSDLISGGAATVGAWNHVAVTRSGTTTRLFLRGGLIGSATDNTTYLQLSDRPAIGAAGWTLGDFPFNGKISNLRVVKGAALYTGAFTPPTSPLTAISGTQLLTCQGMGFLDMSANHYALTANTGAKVSPASPF